MIKVHWLNLSYAVCVCVWGGGGQFPGYHRFSEGNQIMDSTMFCPGEPDMDCTRRAMLLDPSLVQHDLLESPDHGIVHVIYGQDNTTFVRTELTKELETRTGLQLVPPQSRVATSSSKGDGVVIVIVDWHDSFTEQLLREAVETAGHPDTHTLFLQKGWFCPHWAKLPGSTLKQYPQSVNERPQFWNTVSSAIGQCARVQSEVYYFILFLAMLHTEYFSTVLLHYLHSPTHESVYMHECFDQFEHL